MRQGARSEEQEIYDLMGALASWRLAKANVRDRLPAVSTMTLVQRHLSGACHRCYHRQSSCRR